MNNRHDPFSPRTFVAIDNRRVVRAACVHGNTWQVETTLAGAEAVTLASDATDPNVIYAGTQGNGVYRSGDCGRNWTPWGLGGQIVKSLAISPHDPGVIYAGLKPAAIYKSVDGGRNWNELEGFRRVPNRWWWFSPAEAPFRAYVNGNVWHTVDYGDSWRRMPFDLGSALSLLVLRCSIPKSCPGPWH